MAALKKPSKPKYKALPKAPKMTGSKESWNTYEQKVKKIIAENDKLKAAYEKALKAFEAEKKNRERIKEKASAAKSKI
jgi:hypothetical protein